MIKNIDIEEIAFTTNREQIVQTGTNIFNIDPVSPVFKISREEMKASGAINIKDFIGNLSANNGSGLNLPMALGRDGSWSGSEEYMSPISNIGVGHLNLRGLGFGSTLGLINGRRGGITPFITRYHHDQFFDLNQLPLSMIENVEILTEGASALYGSQAVSGVANIITRKNFDGFELNVDAQTVEVMMLDNSFAELNIVADTLNMSFKDRVDAEIFATTKVQNFDMYKNAQLKINGNTEGMNVHLFENASLKASDLDAGDVTLALEASSSAYIKAFNNFSLSSKDSAKTYLYGPAAITIVDFLNTSQLNKR